MRAPKPGSEAERVGVRDGDVILTVAGNDIEVYGDVNPALNKRDPGDKVMLKVQRIFGYLLEVSVTRP